MALGLDLPTCEVASTMLPLLGGRGEVGRAEQVRVPSPVCEFHGILLRNSAAGFLILADPSLPPPPFLLDPRLPPVPPPVLCPKSCPARGS